MATASLKCFGVGDGFPSAERGHSSFLYRFGECSLLIDCGDGTTSRYQAEQLSFDLVDHFFLSHLHADHVGGLLMFMQGLWLRKRTKELTLTVPREAIEPLRQMFHAAYLFEEMFHYKLRFAALQAAQAVQVKQVRVTPFPTTHLNSIRKSYQARYPQAYEAYAFLLESGPLRVAHSADLGAPEDLAPLLAQPVDLLVCELAHFTPEALFEYLAGRAFKKLLLIHLPEKLWQNRAALLALAAKKLPGIPCEIAQAGQELTLG